MQDCYAQNNTQKVQGTHDKVQIEQPTIPDTAKVGIYIFSIYDLDFPGNKFNADFYVWYNTFTDSLSLTQNFELVNSRDAVKSGETSEKKNNIIYESFRCNSVIKKEWDIKNFPFDKQVVEIEIEDVDKDESKLIFIADSLESKIDKNVHLEGWIISNFGIKTENHTYETTYGDPSLAPTDYSTYSRVIVYFTLERKGSGLFFKLFIGLFISVLISLVTFFINPMDLDPRFGLSVGAIFTAIASQYVISSSLPQNQQLTLVDTLHDLSFIYIFLCILVSTASLYYMKSGKENSSRKLDKYSLIILAVSYFILTGYFILQKIT